MILCRDLDIKLLAMRLSEYTSKEAFCERKKRFLSDLVRDLSYSIVDHSENIPVGDIICVLKEFYMCSPILASHLVQCGFIESLVNVLRDKCCNNWVVKGASECLLHIAQTLPASKSIMRNVGGIEGLQTSCYFSTDIYNQLSSNLYNQLFIPWA